MDFDEAKAVVRFEATQGMAYKTRFGDYPTAEESERVAAALRVIHAVLKGEAMMDRKLAADLFVLNDQIQGNLGGAIAKDVVTAEEFIEEGFVEINDLLYAIFQDWADTDQAEDTEVV